MGTEQQQELKSEKACTKPKRKVVPFNDHSIEAWKPKKDKDRIGFVLSNTTKGIKVIYRKKTNQKYWELTYYLKKKELTTSLGPFIPDIRGTEYLVKEMLELIGKHKDLRRTHWLTDPKKTIKEKDQKVVEEDQRKEDDIKRKADLKKALVPVNSVIESLCIAGFPKAKIKDEFLSASSIRVHINFLIGSNKRTQHLSYTDDRDGNGKIFFKPSGPQSFPELFQKYPPGVDVVKSVSGEISLYDSKTGKRPIKELTPTVVEQYLTSKERSQGQTENILLALQCLWTYACKQKVFGENIPDNPTSRRDNRIIIMKSRDSKYPGRAYNDKIFKKDDLPKLDRAFVNQSPKFPFQAEALNFMAVTGRRQEETTKIRYEMITKDEDGNPIILMPGAITKARRPVKVDITGPVQKILDQLDYLLKGPYKGYRMVPYLFPTLRINKVRLSEHTYLNSDHTRVKNLEGCWKAIEKETGITGSPKMFRKTFYTYGGDEVGDDDMIILSDHKDKKTALDSYKKFTNAKRKKLADKVAKIFTFPRVVNE